jgi:sugar phosphate isomerase/epimerase
MTLRLAYNTNGWPQHTLDDIVTVLAESGYAGIAITPDTFHLDPFDRGSLERAAQLRRRLDELNMAVAIETGARFILDPRRKHHPTLLCELPEATRRLEYLRRCLDLATALRAETFSFWSGAAPAGLEPEDLLARLCHGAAMLLDAASDSGVRMCFEPEPGMAVAGLEDLGDFLLTLGREDLYVMLDVGHVPVTESIGPDEAIVAFGERIGGVQLDDCKGGRHEHLFFGEGEIDFGAVTRALGEVGYTGLASVELPRHAFDPVTTARRALEFWRGLEGAAR